MALPASGNPISINQVRAEMSNPNGSLKTLSTTDVNAASSDKPDGSTPHSLSEFYSYDHSASAGLTEEALIGPFGDPNEGCGQAGDTGFFHDGGGSPYANGVTYYQNDDNTSPTAEAGFYMYGSGESGISINESGVVNGAFDC
jgi:hypothetical protein|tara:strand:+ start:73 stop:501 length:429 start_codon:yes stop_codon:yes gene_type:complete